MKSNFDDCLNRVLKDEGGYSNDPSDSGGATNFGITIADYRLYIKKNGTPLDVKNMRLEDAKQIYRLKYWNALGCDSLPSGVDYSCFDYGVNSGLGRPRKALDAFKSLKGTDLINAINNERTAFLRDLAVRRPKDQKFLKGWLNRVSRVRNYSIYLSSHKPDNVSGPVNAGIVAVAGTAAATYTNHSTALIIGSIAVAAVVGVLVHIYRNRK